MLAGTQTVPILCLSTVTGVKCMHLTVANAELACTGWHLHLASWCCMSACQGAAVHDSKVRSSHDISLLLWDCKKLF